MLDEEEIEEFFGCILRHSLKRDILGFYVKSPVYVPNGGKFPGKEEFLSIVSQMDEKSRGFLDCVMKEFIVKKEFGIQEL